MAKKATIGALVVTLGANSAQLVSELNKTKKGAQDWSVTMQKTAKVGAASFLAVGAAATTAGIGIIAIVEKNSEALDNLAKTSDKLGLVPQALQLMRYQAELSGVSMGTLDMATQRMVRRVAEAAQGTGEAVNALRELRLDADKLAQMSPDQQFYAIAEAMKDVANQNDRVRLAMKLFDSEGVSLVNTLVSDLEAAEQKFDSMGIAITRQQLAMVEAYNDAKTDLGMLAQGFGEKLTVYLSGPFQEILRYIEEVVLGMGGVDNAAATTAGVVIDVMAGMITGAQGVVTAINSIRLAWLETQLADAEFRKWQVDTFGGGLLEDLVGADRSVYKEVTDLQDKIAGINSTNTNIAAINAELEQLKERLKKSIPDPGDSNDDGPESNSGTGSAGVTGTNGGRSTTDGLDRLGNAALTASEYLQQLGDSAKMGKEGQDLFNDIMGIIEPKRKTDGPIEKNYAFRQTVRATDARIKDGDAVNTKAWLDQMKQAYEIAMRDQNHNYDVVGMEQIITKMEAMAEARFGDLDEAAKKGSETEKSSAEFAIDGRTFTILADSSMKLSEQVNKMLGIGTSGNSVAEITRNGKTQRYEGANPNDVTADYEHRRQEAADAANKSGGEHKTLTLKVQSADGEESADVHGTDTELSKVVQMFTQASLAVQ